MIENTSYFNVCMLVNDIMNASCIEYTKHTDYIYFI